MLLKMLTWLKMPLTRQMICDRIHQCFPTGVTKSWHLSLETFSVSVCHEKCPLSSLSCWLHFYHWLVLRAGCMSLSSSAGKSIFINHMRLQRWWNEIMVVRYPGQNSKVLNKHCFQSLFKCRRKSFSFSLANQTALLSLRCGRMWRRTSPQKSETLPDL